MVKDLHWGFKLQRSFCCHLNYASVLHCLGISVSILIQRMLDLGDSLVVVHYRKFFKNLKLRSEKGKEKWLDAGGSVHSSIMKVASFNALHKILFIPYSNWCPCSSTDSIFLVSFMFATFSFFPFRFCLAVN